TPDSVSSGLHGTYWRTRAVSDLLEPCEVKVSSTVLRGGAGGDTRALPGENPLASAGLTCRREARSNRCWHDDGSGLCSFCGAVGWRSAPVPLRPAEAAKGTAAPPSSANTNGHCQQALCVPVLPSSLLPWRDDPLVLPALGRPRCCSARLESCSRSWPLS